MASDDPGNDPDRVVLFHDFSEALGGASHLAQVLIRELRQRGVPITFIAGDDGRNFTREDVEFIPLHGKPLLERSKFGALTTGLHLRKAYTVTRDWIAANDTPRTIYHVNGWCKILTPAIFSALRQVRERVVLHGHDYFNCCPNGAFFNYVTEQDCKLVPLSRACMTSQCDKASYAQKLWRTVREASRRSQFGGGTQASRLLLIHPGQRPSFERGGWPPEKLVPVRNPVVPPCRERVPAERNRGILFIGRISTEKGADLAAQAAARAGEPITFVGEGAEMPKVRALNPDARFLGRLDQAGIAAALSEARLAVMPSRWSEPFGLVALEAIGSGVPVIVSDRALVGEEIAQAGFGLAIDTRDVEAFAEAISALSGNDRRIEEMSRAGHAHYLDLCSTESGWAGQILQNYHAVLSETGS